MRVHEVHQRVEHHGGLGEQGSGQGQSQRDRARLGENRPQVDNEIRCPLEDKQPDYDDNLLLFFLKENLTSFIEALNWKNYERTYFIVGVGVLWNEVILRHVLHATVDHDQERQSVAPYAAEHDVGHVLVVGMHEVHSAARACWLESNPGPAHQRGQAPEQWVYPYEQDHKRSDLVLWRIDFLNNPKILWTIQV